MHMPRYAGGRVAALPVWGNGISGASHFSGGIIAVSDSESFPFRIADGLNETARRLPVRNSQILRNYLSFIIIVG